MSKPQFGLIQEGVLKGKKIILHPRVGLKDNEWIIERTIGSNEYTLHCLACEKEIPVNGCPNCQLKN